LVLWIGPFGDGVQRGFLDLGVDFSAANDSGFAIYYVIASESWRNRRMCWLYRKRLVDPLGIVTGLRPEVKFSRRRQPAVGLGSLAP